MGKKYFVVICNYSIEGESGVDIIGVKEKLEDAKKIYQKQLKEEKQNAKNNNYDYIEEDLMSYSSYIDGEYLFNHIDLYIEEVEETDL